MSLLQIVFVFLAVAPFVYAQTPLFQDFQGGTVNTEIDADGVFELFEDFTPQEGNLPGDAAAGALNIFSAYGDNDVSVDTELQSVAVNGNTFAAGLFNSSVTGTSFTGDGAIANGTNFVVSATTPDYAVQALFSDQTVEVEGPGETSITSSGSGVAIDEDVGSSSGFQVFGSDQDSGEDPDSNVVLGGAAFAGLGFSNSSSTVCAGDNCP